MPKIEVICCKEVAKMLGVTEGTVRGLCKAGQIPHFRIGNLYRFNKQKILEKYLLTY